MRKFLIGVLVGCLLMMTTPVLADSILQSIDVVFDSVQVQVDGEKLDTNTILYNGSTYLPMRKVAEAVGKDIEWEQETMTANIVEKKVGDVMETATNEIEIFNINDSSNCYAVKDNTTYYHAWHIVMLMNENGNNGDYGMDINNLPNIKLFDRDNNTVIENIPYELIKDRVFISKDYYENTILPLIK